MKNTFSSRNVWQRWLPVLAFALVALVTFWTCKYPADPVNPNTPPRTRLANVPVEDSGAVYINQNTFPEISLSWLGDDPDGYVVGYRYRWIDFLRGNQQVVQPYTTILNLVRPGWENVIALRGSPQSVYRIHNFLATLGEFDRALIDTIGSALARREPFAVPYKTGIVPTDSIIGMDRLVLQSPTTGTFIFSSPADSNLHRFEISSIDNRDVIDPNPARVNFWTLRSPGSVVTIQAGPDTNSNALCIRYPTDVFLGLRFQFLSLDPNNTQDISYQWAVDDTSQWSPWQIENFAFVTASSFNPIASGRHTFYVRSRNRWGVLSPVARRPFTVIIPEFDDPAYQQRILIVNSTAPPGTGSAYSIDTNAVRSFYSSVFDSVGKAGKYDILHLAPSPTTRFPTFAQLGRYSLLVFLLESKPPVLGLGRQYAIDATRLQRMLDYARVGGRLIFSGIPDPITNFGGETNYRRFMDSILYVRSIVPQLPVLQNNNRDFIGMKGQFGYPNIMVDPAKLHPDSLGAIRYIALAYPTSFAQAIGLYDSRVNDPLFEDQPVAVRFLAAPTTPPVREAYSIVYFGFPLYYCQTSAVIQGMRKALSDVKELNR